MSDATSSLPLPMGPGGASRRRLPGLALLALPKRGYLRLPLGAKIALPPVFVMACLLFIAAIAWLANSGLSRELRNVAERGMVRMDQAHRQSAALQELQLGATQFVAALAVKRDAVIIDAAKARLVVKLTEFEKTVAEAGKTAGAPAQAASAPEVPTEESERAEDLQAITDAVATYRQRYEKMLAVTSGDVAGAASALEMLNDAHRIAADKIDILLGREANAAQQSLEKGEALATQNVRAIVGCLVVSVLLSAFIGWACTRHLTAVLQQGAAIAAALAKGDLTQRAEVGSHDVAGRTVRSLSDVSTHLSRLVVDVRDAAVQVELAAGEIDNGNQDLSRRTEHQASVLEETASSMEQLNATVRKNADNARQANQLAVNASSVAAKGGEVVTRVVATMRGINESSRTIADIIGVIDSIAFQTNILALNAAVEAARAGDQGRGFAVVASEVRNLASRSAAAAKQIKTLIHTSVERVDLGTTLVDQAGATMAEVVDSIRQVTQIMGEINASSTEQSTGVSQVCSAVTQLDLATQQNAALVEEMAASAGSLKNQASELVQAMAVFKLGAAG